MDHTRTSLLQKVLPQWTVFTMLMVLYLWTIAPGLTWANGGSDGGDLITAAATGGVAHPTGYPLYLLLARLFQLLPVGSLAFRTNLMSALAMSLTAALVCHLVLRFIPPGKPLVTWLSGMAAGFAFGLAPLVWSQAVITEVYALQALLTVLVLQLYTLPDAQVNPRRLDCLRGLLLGLALGNHVTGILLVPVAVLLGALRSGPSLRFDPVSLRTQLLCLGAGLALYLLLPLRALAGPPVNWGNVTTPERFWWLVSGGVYQSYYLQSSLPGLGERVQSFASLLLQQFGLAGVALALLGRVVFGSRSRLYLLTTWTVLAYGAFALFYRSSDSHLYLIPAFLCFAIWLGLGLSGLARLRGPRHAWLGPGLALLVILNTGVRSVSILQAVDASQDLQAEAFGREVLAAAPQDAILFARGDPAVFALWYFHFALGERPDLTVIAEDLLHFDWYQENLRSTYPSLAVTGPFPWPETITLENPARPVCHVEYTDRSPMECRR